MPPKGKGKRKIEEVTADDNGGYARIYEKEKLLQALKDHGPGVIHDYDLLKSYFPSMSLEQIKFLIASYEKKGKDFCSRENYIDSFPEMKNIAQWSSIISSCVPFGAKKDDLALILKNVFEQLGSQFSHSSTSPLNHTYNDNTIGGDEEEEEEEEEEEIDYRAVHTYFNSILNKRYPMKLENREASVVLSMIDNLIKMVEDLDNSLGKDYLTSEAWWKPTATVTNGVTSKNCESEMNNQSSTSQNVNQNGQDITNDNNNPDDPEFYQDLPRFRKIRECLNPLKIPRDILDDNHNSMTLFLD